MVGLALPGRSEPASLSGRVCRTQVGRVPIFAGRPVAQEGEPPKAEPSHRLLMASLHSLPSQKGLRCSPPRTDCAQGATLGANRPTVRSISDTDGPQFTQVFGIPGAEARSQVTWMSVTLVPPTGPDNRRRQSVPPDESWYGRFTSSSNRPAGEDTATGELPPFIAKEGRDGSEARAGASGASRATTTPGECH